MKSTLPEKSKSHETRISQITQTIIQSGQDKICFVILFGSFARGDWVFDRNGSLLLAFVDLKYIKPIIK